MYIIVGAIYVLIGFVTVGVCSDEIPTIWYGLLVVSLWPILWAIGFGMAITVTFNCQK